MVNTIAIVLAYLVTILLITGGFLCLYVSLRMISRRVQASGSATSFTADIAGHKIAIGTGSLAALVLSISVLWALVALLSRPKLEFAVDGQTPPQGALKLISSATIKNVENADAEIADRVLARLSQQSTRYLAMDAATADAAQAADAAAASADAAAASADAAAQASADAAADGGSSGQEELSQ